jgi:hypothetical protein
MSAVRLRWTHADGTSVTIEDNGSNLDITLRWSATVYQLTAEPQSWRRAYYLQDIVSTAYTEGRRGHGAGTMLMNTLVQYLSYHPDKPYDTLRGFLYHGADGGDLTLAQGRHKFFRYLIPDRFFDGDDFTVPVSALTQRQGHTLSSGIPSLVPVTAFQRV